MYAGANYTAAPRSIASAPPMAIRRVQTRNVETAIVDGKIVPSKWFVYSVKRAAGWLSRPCRKFISNISSNCTKHFHERSGWLAAVVSCLVEVNKLFVPASMTVLGFRYPCWRGNSCQSRAKGAWLFGQNCVYIVFCTSRNVDPIKWARPLFRRFSILRPFYLYPTILTDTAKYIGIPVFQNGVFLLMDDAIQSPNRSEGKKSPE